MAERFRNFIAGEWVEPSTGAYFENRNPADTEDLIGLWPRSGREDVDRAVASAQRGFELWQVPAPARRRHPASRRYPDGAQGRDRPVMTREMGRCSRRRVATSRR